MSIKGNGIQSTFIAGLGAQFKRYFYSTVAKNAFSLYLIHFANYLIPLVTVPYVVRVLTPHGYGLVAFGMSLIGYFMVVVDYGFTFSATRRISVQRNDSISVSRTAFNVWAAKILLCVGGLAVLLVLITVVPQLRQVDQLMLILYGMVVGNVLFPVWLFQGMERMVAISVINLVMRLFVVIGIFTLIHRPEDYLLYAGLTSMGSIGAGIAGVGVALHMFKLPFVFPSWRGIGEALVEGWMLFLSMASVSLYTVGNAFILGLLTNHTAVGYYAAAEKIVKAVLGLLGPLSQAVYPRFSKMASDSKALALKWGRRMLLLMGGLGLTLSMALFVGAPAIVRIVLGPEYGPSTTVIRILAALPLLIGISNVLGIQTMLPFRRERAFASVLLCAGLINIGLAILFAPIWQESGMAAAVLLSEAFVTVSMLIYLRLANLNPLTVRGEVNEQ